MTVLRTIAIALIALVPLGAQSSEQLDFMAGVPDGRDLRDMLPSYMKEKAFRMLEERRQKVARFSSAADVRERRQYLRDRMLEAIGSFPPRTPLNARVVGVIERDDYRIEKVIFESQPRFYVTGNLYVPKRGTPPYPGILFPLGHESGAKANPVWQQILGSLAEKGFLALAWDPLGQGERVELFDEDFGASKVVRSTTEHTINGIQCLLVGDNLARYTIWDGIRALDYLLSRKEVDPKRIGCTGNSGGGTHTAYLSALEDRIHVAAPSCYLTTWERLVATIGPQDAEQCIPPWIADGLDHADFVHAFAPKPYLILSAIRDFFSISGARTTFAEAQHIYSLLDAGDRIHMVEADDGHGYSKPRRMAAYRWLSRWLKGAEDEGPEPEVVIATEEELYCTETGQVATSLGGETVFSLNRKRLEEARRAAKPSSVEDVRSMVAYEKREGPLPVHPFGQIDRDGYRIEKLVYESEPGIRVPSLLYIPAQPAGRKEAAVFVDDRGKAAAHSEVEELVKSGLVVLSIDARGYGETGDPARAASDWPGYFGAYHPAMTALLTGKPLVAMRAEDIARGVDLLAARPEVDRDRIYAFGKRSAAVPVLYAAAFDPRIRKVALDEMLVSYEAVVNNRIHRQVFENVVNGALRHFDLPDLIGWIAPRPVWVVDAQDPVGNLAGLQEVRRQYVRSLEAFKRARAEPELRILRRQPADSPKTLYRDMISSLR